MCMRLTFSICLVVCLFLSACSSGPKPVKITGKLTNGDKPFKVDPKTPFDVVFVPIVEKGQALDTYPATINRDDMSFTINGKKGDGIPVGKYRVAIQQRAR